jgi:diguanylate cyclase (GGDEF)-like protein
MAPHYRFEVALQPETQAHDTARDPVLDGRDSLRLVKLRLGLTLIAVAILPIAAVSPLVRAVAEEARVTHHERLIDQAQTAALEIRRELTALRTAAADLLTEPAVKAAAAGDASPTDRRKARETISRIVDGKSGLVAGATLLTADGARAFSGDQIDVAALPQGVVLGGLAAIPDKADARILVVQSSEQGDKPARTLIAAVSVPALLMAATPKTDLPGRSLRMADASGVVIAEASGSFDPSAIPGEVLDIATMAAGDSDGKATLDLPGIAGWQVVVAAPIPLVALPVTALGALVAMLLLLIGFTIWMARQILRPAAALEAQRSHLRELYETAREAALRDSLTGLGNHRAFQEAVARMVDGARRYGTEFSLVLIDIDEFKRINDTKGHAVGDQLLAEVGELIAVTIRISDAAFRVGGDEFALLLPHTDAEGATQLARRLLARGLEDRTNGYYRDPISFSAGVTSCPEFGTTRLELTSQADAALYRGKRNGRTVVTTYDPEKDHGHVDEGMRAELSSAITAVIEGNSLTPVYQPIVELATGRVVAYEGLVRVPKESTFAHTGAMFDAAEVAGRVADLDRAALDVVLRGAHDLPEWVSLSVNISPRTLESAEVSSTTFLAILRRHGMTPDRITLELTERESILHPDRLRAALTGMQDAGVRIAADDVGAGNAGLRLLSLFRFDVVKIDLSLVQRGSDDQTNSVLRSIVEVADRMGASTTAEGVETSGQLRTARRLGITNGQGYLLGRPGAERDLTWVDIAALEQRDDVGIPIRDMSDQAMPPRSLAERIGERPDPDLPAEEQGMTTVTARSGIKLPSIAFLKASRGQQSE